MNGDRRKKLAGTHAQEVLARQSDSLLVEHAPRSHFFDLVANGRHPGASSGAKRARRLALAVVDDLPGLDAEAVAGLHDFLDLVVAMPSTARDLIEDE